MEDLGALGFWLMIGMVVAASIVSEAIKERNKEREKQAMLLALLDKDGKSVTEVLAYLREKDAAEAAAVAAAAARDRANWRRVWSRLPAIATGVFALAGGILAGAALRFGLLRESESPLIPLLAMFGIWVAGLIIARRMWRSAKQKDDAHPDA